MTATPEPSASQTMDEVDERILARYTTALARCRQMRAHAAQGAWESLVVLQHAYVDEIEQLSALEHGLQLAPATNAQKRDLLVQIRDTENQVRALLDARMRQLSEHMARSRCQRQVQQAYEADSACGPR